MRANCFKSCRYQPYQHFEEEVAYVTFLPEGAPSLKHSNFAFSWQRAHHLNVSAGRLYHLGNKTQEVEWRAKGEELADSYTVRLPSAGSKIEVGNLLN